MKTIQLNEWDEATFVVRVTETGSARQNANHGFRRLTGRYLCVANRTARKALVAAELAFWQATGGDSLHWPQPN